MFFVFSLVFVTLVVLWPWQSHVDLEGDLSAVGFYLALALYCWSVSLRLRRIGNAQRRGELGELNTDLGLPRRLFLIYRGGWIAKYFFYCFSALPLILGLVVSLAKSNPPLTSKDILIFMAFMGAFCIPIALVIRADSLSRRGMEVSGFSLEKAS